MIARRALVQQQPHGAAVGRDDDVDVAVVVDVAERGASADLGALEGRPAVAARIDEAPVAGIVEQLVLHLERVRLAALRLDCIDGAVGDEEIEPAVVVVVEPVGAEARDRCRQRAETRLRPARPRNCRCRRFGTARTSRR